MPYEIGVLMITCIVGPVSGRTRARHKTTSRVDDERHAGEGPKGLPPLGPYEAARKEALSSGMHKAEAGRPVRRDHSYKLLPHSMRAPPLCHFV
jgi:hypothetical protein